MQRVSDERARNLGDRWISTREGRICHPACSVDARDLALDKKEKKRCTPSK